jgi:serine/threonine-protein kinase
MQRMAEDLALGGHVVTGRYRLVHRIGESPVAFYEARHPRLSGRFAARLWPATAPWDAFRRGAEIASALRHPGVVQVIDFNCEPGSSPFLVTEWIDGTTLSELLAANGIIGVARVATLVESAAWSLAAAHQQGVVHQELEPVRIFVVQAPGTTREWTKIDGFGLAAALVRAGAAPPSAYHAPEQASPEDDAADPQSDQYALAAIAYEMMAGVRPFEEGLATSGGEPTAISEIVAGISGAVDTVIRQALSADPERRYAGVLEFARALRNAAHGPDTQVIHRRKTEGRAWGRAQPGEPPVSPFFNPVQSPTSEGLRPVRTPPEGRTVTGVAARTALVRGAAQARRALARLRNLRPERLVPRGASARAGIASAALLFAIGGVAVVVSHPPRKPPPPASAAAKAPSSLMASAATASPASAAFPPVWPAAVPEGQPPPESPASEPEPPGPEPEPRVSPRRARLRAVALARTAAGTSTGIEGGACAITVASKPRADVWLDERNVGRRTPLTRFRVGCGDHKLVLRRDDLGLYQMELITVQPGAPFRKLYPLR